MRRGVVALVLIAFAAFVPWKVVPFLKLARPDVWATPTVTPDDPALLAPLAVKGGRRICVDRMIYGPEARYVAVIVKTPRPTGPLRVEARAPGYAATAQVPAGLTDNARAIAKIAPAPRDVADGTLCIANEGRHSVSFYGVPLGGRAAAPSLTTVDGRPAPAQLSVTLLRSPTRSLWGQLGSVFDRVAAFRPVAPWMAALLFALLLVGAPVALAVALGRAAAQDDAAAGQPRARR